MNAKAQMPEEKEAGRCKCPFCDQSTEMPYPFCQVCGAELRFCPICGQPLPQDAEACAHCGGEA